MKHAKQLQLNNFIISHMMTTIGNTWMDQLSGSVAFNTGGVASILSFLGFNITNANLYMTFGIGILSALWLILKLYLTFCQIKETKNKLKKKNK